MQRASVTVTWLVGGHGWTVSAEIRSETGQQLASFVFPLDDDRELFEHALNTWRDAFPLLFE